MKKLALLLTVNRLVPTYGYKSTYTARAPGPLNSKICSMSISFAIANFCQKYFVA